MDTKNQAANPTQPIRDIAPPGDNSAANPTQFANIPVQKTPVSEQAMHTNPITSNNLPVAKPNPANQKGDDLDKVLKDVNKEVKEALQKPKALAKPTLAIAVAIIVGVVLMTAAFFAFRGSN